MMGGGAAQENEAYAHRQYQPDYRTPFGPVDAEIDDVVIVAVEKGAAQIDPVRRDLPRDADIAMRQYLGEQPDSAGEEEGREDLGLPDDIPGQFAQGIVRHQPGQLSARVRDRLQRGDGVGSIQCDLIL